jgi:hypothetical protein
MVEGNPSPDNSPQRLTVESAASQIEGMFSDDFTIVGDKKTPPVKPAKKTPEPKDDEQIESLASQGESDEGDEVESADADTDEVDPSSENAQLEADNEADVDDEPVEKPKFRVKVRGEEVEVTQDELLNGYSRQADYTRSKQELALEKAKFEKEEKLAVRESAKKYAEGLTQIEETLRAMQPQEPDWDKLAIDHPEQFATQRAMWQLNKERLQAVANERQRAADVVARDQAEAHAQTIRAEAEHLLELVPAWKDNKVAMKEKSEIAKYVKDLGFSDEDIKSIYKASQMVLLRNAYLYSKSLAKKPAIQEKIDKIKSVTPGTTDTARPGQKAQERRQQRLKKTGSVRDAAAVIENIPGLLD